MHSLNTIATLKSAYRLRLFTDNKRVYEDECGLNECIGLFSSFHNTYLDDLIVE
jgi:hypothetical protein